VHIATGGGPNAKHDVKTVVVYDPVSGHIIHTHHVVTLVGGTRMEDEQIRARALNFARDLVAGSGRTTTGKLETIFVDGRATTPGTTYTVDTKRRVLVAGQSFTKRRKA